MKIFNKTEGWSTKVNFVDKNNVLVGFDMEESCCEQASWCIMRKMPEDLNEGLTSNDTSQISDAELKSYVFDTEFFEEKSIGVYAGHVDCLAIFKLVNRWWSGCRQEAYLILRNQHNGYYAHGFEAKIGDDSWQGGAL
jgi:hypothetical protein